MGSFNLKFLWGSISLLIVFAIIYFICVRAVSTLDSNDSYKPDIEDLIEYVNTKKKLESDSENKPLPSLTIIDTSYVKVDLYTIGRQKSALVFYFPSTGCQLCAQQEIKRLNKLKISKQKLNLILVSNFQSDREFKLFGKWYDSDLEWYNSLGQKFNLPIEKMGIPFYFMLDADLKGECSLNCVIKLR